MKRADKYPAIDPRIPNLYRKIVDAAATMRTARHAENEVAWLMARVRISAKAEAEASLADAEPVSFPTLSPSGGVSSPVPAAPASEDSA